MISVLIPWRSTDPDRIRAWRYNLRLWRRLPVELCVADDGREGAFSVARAVNRARRMASGDMLAVFGADHIPDATKLEWIADRLSALPWTGVYAGTQLLSPAGTRLILHGMPVAPVARAYAYRIDMCLGIVAVRAEVWDDTGGMDERFIGWGAEDVAHRLALASLYPDGRGDGEGDVVTMWHPLAPRDETPTNNARYQEYEKAANEGRMREYLREVHGAGPGD